MSLFKLCKGKDDVVTQLFAVYGANILRVPEKRVEPLTIFARRGDQHTFRAKLSPLLAPKRLPSMKPKISPMAEVSGKRTRKVDAKVGLEILGGLLQGIGVQSAAVTGEIVNAREVSFSVGEVNRHWIDPGLLGRNLEQRRVDPKKAAAKMYFGADKWDLLVVDSTITSQSFAINVERSARGGAKINIPAINEVVAKASAGASATRTAQLGISFHGGKPLTFAFSCVRLFLEPNGRISLINPQETFLNAAVASGDVVLLPNRVRLSREPAMIQWD